jgi:hypothetical protein
MSYESLKARQRAERHAHHPNLALRVHRALSWLHRAEQLERSDDQDGRFIFLWIAFNAAYATEIDDRYRLSEQGAFRAFLQKLVDLDAGRGRIEELVWREFPCSIRLWCSRASIRCATSSCTVAPPGTVPSTATRSATATT